MSDGGLFDGLFARGGAAGEVSDRAFLQAMLDAEVALLRALARAGLAPTTVADEVADAADAATFDLAALGRSAADQGTPVPGLVSGLRDRVSNQAAAHLHRGATSQDIVDTATMLLARRSLEPLLADLGGAADTCASLADEHRMTLMPGRTLLQQALPVTFGLKAAVWLSGLDGVRRELIEVRSSELALQLGGAVGTLAGLDDRGLEVQAHMAEELGLAVPELPWHTIRLAPIRLAAALGGALGVMGKIARDIALLAQTEVAEAAELGDEGYGGSSTIPHKRNPIGAIAVIACAQRAPGLVASLFSSMVQEHERAAGAWQAEWQPLLELLRLTGSAAASLRQVLVGLDVFASKMRTDLDTGGALIMSESVATALARSVGRAEAQRIVAAAAARATREGLPFRDAVLEIDPALEDALDPAGYLGVSEQLIERALASHWERRSHRGSG